MWDWEYRIVCQPGQEVTVHRSLKYKTLIIPTQHVIMCEGVCSIVRIYGRYIAQLNQEVLGIYSKLLYRRLEESRV